MRQPNHLSSLLLWSIVAVVWLGESRAASLGHGSAGSLLRGRLALLFVVVLSGSRTGALGTLTLAGVGSARPPAFARGRGSRCVSRAGRLCALVVRRPRNGPTAATMSSAANPRFTAARRHLELALRDLVQHAGN